MRPDAFNVAMEWVFSDESETSFINLADLKKSHAQKDDLDLQALDL